MTVICGDCGNPIPDTEEHNVFYGIIPYPADDGYGLCFPCIGVTEKSPLQEEHEPCGCAQEQ